MSPLRFLRFFVAMSSALKITTTYTLELETTGQKWTLPAECVKHLDGQDWVKLSATKYGFLKLLLGDRMSKNQSLANCEAWKQLLEQRNQKSVLHPSASSLWDNEDEEGKSKKRKRSGPNADDVGSTAELDLGNGYGKVLVRTAKKTNEDLQVHLEVSALSNLCTFLQNSDLQAGSQSSRTYRKTGQFQGVSNQRKRKMLAQEIDEPGEDKSEE